MDLRPTMSYAKRFPQLKTDAVENAAIAVISQLKERLSFSKIPTSKDEEMECLQFGICSYQVQEQRITL